MVNNAEWNGSSMAIGKLFHIIHMTGDLPALEAWYDDVFSVQRGFLDHHYMEGEKRDASLVVLGDCVIEPLASTTGSAPTGTPSPGTPTTRARSGSAARTTASACS
jgi:hypothetical protein